MKLALVSSVAILSLSSREEFSDVLLALADIFVEYFRPAYNLRFMSIKCLCYLSGNQSLACAWWAIQKHPLHMLDPVHIQYCLRVASRVESTPENIRKLLIEPTYPHLLKIEVLLKQLVRLELITQNYEPPCVLRHHLELRVPVKSPEQTITHALLSSQLLLKELDFTHS